MEVIIVLALFGAVAYAGYVQTFEHNRELRMEIHNDEENKSDK